MEILFPLLCEDKKIVLIFQEITKIINQQLKGLDITTTLPETTTKTLSKTGLEVVSIKPDGLCFKVLFPKMDGTPKIDSGAKNASVESVKRRSHTMNLTMAGPLSIEHGIVQFKKISVEQITAIISEFTVLQDKGEQTLSMTRTSYSEVVHDKLISLILEVCNIVFQAIQGPAKH